MFTPLRCEPLDKRYNTKKFANQLCIGESFMFCSSHHVYVCEHISASKGAIIARHDNPNADHVIYINIIEDCIVWTLDPRLANLA